MVKFGQIIEYNGNYGYIKADDEIIDFETEDLSVPVKVGDIVEFREEKGDYLTIARNIKVVEE